MSTVLPNLADTTQRPFSLTRTNQLPSVLETAFGSLGWSGVVSGGEVIDNGGVSVKVGAGEFLSLGASHTETTDTTYNGLPADGTSYLWVRVAVTRATQTNPGDPDTYDLEIDDNTTGSPPAADAGWFARAIVVTSGGDILSITHLNSTPPGLALPAGTTRIRLPQSYIIPPDTQSIVYGSFVNEGTLITLGDRYLLDF